MHTTAIIVPPLESPELTAAAALAAINRRVGSVYLHDFRGSIHALQGAVELLARLSKLGSTAPDRLEKAAELAKRALTNHEKLMTDMLHRLNGGALGGGLSGSTEPSLAVTLDPPNSYRQLLRDVLLFLRHETERVGVLLELHAEFDCAPPGSDYAQTFVVLMGLILTALDTAKRNTVLRVELSKDAATAWLTISTGDTVNPAADPVLRYAQTFFESVGGGLQVNAANSGQRCMVARHALAVPAT